MHHRNNCLSLCLRVVACAIAVASSLPVHAEIVLQYFNTKWSEIERRMPELAERGYDALWLPPPFKGSSGTYSVGYDCFDRFDLGDRYGSGTIRTKYGTKDELLRMVQVAHRFGIRVYFDNVMAHSAGPLDSSTNPGQLFPGLPGHVPEDFHIVRNGDGSWRKPADWPNWGDEWQVLNRNPFGWDIANEYPDNVSFNPNGTAEGHTHSKWSGIRHPGQTQWYMDTDLTVATNADGQALHPFADKETYSDIGYTDPNTSLLVGAGDGKFSFLDANGNGQHDVGELGEPFSDTGVDGSNPARQNTAWGYGDGRYNMGNPVAEDVNSMLFRAVRWFVDVSKADGFRMDAIKHVPASFFGKQSGADKDQSNWGYIGQLQEQYNVTRGFSDWNNHRDSNFNSNYMSRDDMLVYGEHLGSPPAPGPYVDAGMRVANDDLLNAIKGGIGGGLWGYDSTHWGTWGSVATSMDYVMSHDNNYIWSGDRSNAHAYILTREGNPIIYTDGYNQSGAPDWFPKPAEVPFLGQFGDNGVVGAAAVHRDFARGWQVGRWSDQDFCAYERWDEREKKSGGWSGTTMLFMMARNYLSGSVSRSFACGFPSGATLVNQSPYGGRFRATVNGSGVVSDGNGNPIAVPSNQWYAFSWHNPILPLVWQDTPFQGEHQPIEIYQGGERVGTIDQWRTDGVNGDASFNPYGVPAGDTGERSYRVRIPRVTDGTDLGFVARADGAAGNIRLKLDGGVDINSQMSIGPLAGDMRDFAPGINTDQHETSDTINQSSNEIYQGYEQMSFVHRTCEKFAATDITRNIIGSIGAETYETVIGSPGVSHTNGNGPNDSSSRNCAWALHQPSVANPGSGLQVDPAPENAADQPLDLWVKVGYQFLADKIYVYYTTDGASYPEGVGGIGKGNTMVVEGGWVQNGINDGTAVPDWWKATLPALPSGTVLRYKIGVRRTTDAGEVFPYSNNDINLAERMETMFEIDGFDATTVPVYVNNDYGNMRIGLSEGYHMLSSRNFVTRTDGASIFKTNTQVFYYDVQRPAGQIRYPIADGATLGGPSYGAVVLTDASVTEVWYYIDDLDSSNDDPAAGNGLHAWVKATQKSTPGNLGTTGYQKEWSFNYDQIPATGSASIVVRLVEASSSHDFSKTDTDGWFTTLVRSVQTGTSIPLAIMQPAADGETVDSSYVMRVNFGKDLIPSGMSDADFLDEFSIFISSSTSGQPDNPVLQPRASYVLQRDFSSTEHSIIYELPNLYNGDTEFLHYIQIVHQRGNNTLSDHVSVKMAVDETSDTDGDGLPDFWENLYGFDPQNPSGRHGAQGDDDGDGYGNELEFLTGMNPLVHDPEGYPKLLISPNPGFQGEYMLRFPSIPNRIYQMYYSDDLATWHEWSGTMDTTGQSANPDNQWIDNGWSTSPAPSQVPNRFYRLGISVP